MCRQFCHQVKIAALDKPWLIRLSDYFYEEADTPLEHWQSHQRVPERPVL